MKDLPHFSTAFRSCFCSTIAALAFVTTQAPLALAQEGGVDLAIILDGSGSISSTDFQLQKDGLVAALADPLIYPRDGSFALTLVQFGDSTTRVEVPYTLIEDEGDISSISASISSMTQIGSSTNVGQGIDRGMQVLDASGRPDVIQANCLSTDGLNNSGPSPSSIINFWRTNGIQMDSFGVIAIEDPPFFFEDDFEAAYGPLVFGGGALSVVQNAAEYANTIGVVCNPPQLRLIAIEVNQAVQDWENSVGLVSDKVTRVRVHVETIDEEDRVAIVRLRGFRSGAELPASPLVAFDSPGGSITVGPGAAARRGNKTDSFNFDLPSSWRTGAITVEAEGVGSGLLCEEPAEAGGTAGDCRVSVQFEDVDTPEVRFVRFRWTDTLGTTRRPTSAQITELALRLRAVFPVAAVDWDVALADWGGSEPLDLTGVNSQLWWMRFWDLCWGIFGCDRLYYGVFIGPTGVGGRANGIPGAVSTGTMPAANFVYGRNRHGHEIAHSLGRHHAVNSSVTTTCTNLGGPCGSCASSSAPDFPYIFSVGGSNRATLGPMDQGDDELVYGYDTHSDRIVDPNNNFELMSYCPGWRWISQFTYEGLRNVINSTFDTASALMSGNMSEFWVFRGHIDFDSGAVSFAPFSVITADAPPPTQPLGAYVLRMIDEAGSIIEEIAFEPTASETSAEDPGVGVFTVPVVASDQISEVQVLRDDVMLAQRLRTDAAFATFKWAAADNDDSTFAAVSAPMSGNMNEFCVFRGHIDLDSGAVSFAPFSVITADAPPPMQPPGAYVLRVIDQVGAIIEEIAFEPTEIHLDVPASETSAEDPGVGIFTVPVVASDQISEVQVLRDDVMLAQRLRSDAAPQVEVVVPNGGELVDAAFATFEWAAADNDGDPLSYIVQYTPDDGSTWITLAMDWPDTTLGVDMTALPGGDAARIRVTASDGFQGVVDQSDGVFSVPNRGPRVQINSPRDGTAFAGTQLAILEGQAIDPEDGALQGASLQWHSDLDGFLGEGTELPQDVSELSEGVHDITLLAQDSDGVSGTDTVSIRVTRIAVRNNPPICEAGGPYAANGCADEIITVQVDGTGSMDPDNDALEFLWSTDCPGDGFDDATGGAPILNVVGFTGTCSITLALSDGIATESCSATVDLTANQPVRPSLAITDPALGEGTTSSVSCSFDITNETNDPEDPEDAVVLVTGIEATVAVKTGRGPYVEILTTALASPGAMGPSETASVDCSVAFPDQPDARSIKITVNVTACGRSPKSASESIDISDPD